MDRPGFDGAVLCGGASRRMGRDKALIEIDGVPMARRVVDALREAGASSATAVGGDQRALRAAGVACCADRWPGEGPLGGVITALEVVGDRTTVVVLACDLRQPDAGLIASVAERREATNADAVVPVSAGRPQWVHAAWRRDALGDLHMAFSAGERSLAEASRQLDVHFVDVDDPSRTADADEPADLPTGPSRGHALPTISGVDLPEIDIQTLSSVQADGAPVFDVRQPDEYEEAHVPGVRLVPLDQVPERVAEFPTDGPVYVICKSGGRSAKAVEFLRANDVDAINVAGGTMAWIESGKPVETGA